MAAIYSSVWEEAVPTSQPVARHYSSSQYATSALHGAAPVLEPRGCESEEVHV